MLNNTIYVTGFLIKQNALNNSQDTILSAFLSPKYLLYLKIIALIINSEKAIVFIISNIIYARNHIYISDQMVSVLIII